MPRLSRPAKPHEERAMSDGSVRTTCPYCGVGCGVLATRAIDGAVTIAGDPDHPANFGRLCSKGSALAETLSLDDRLLTPLVHGKRASWETALDLVARRFTETIAAHGPDSVAFYVSGQLLTEDYYVANKLMKAFIGSANIDTNSRLCMASSVAGHKRAFGADTVPGTYEDLELADLVVLAGSNLAWCHPVLFQRLAAARKARGTKVVVIDPRKTATCDIADLHLALKPGTDVALFNGLLTTLMAAGALDKRYVDDHTSGARAAFATARSMSFAEIARLTGLSRIQLHEFYDLFAKTERVVTVYSQGVNQSSSGTDKVNAIINCHLGTGRIGKPGMGPFSVTGQPNAMGGREVGGLANMLAAHMDLGDATHRALVQTFWDSPRIADKPGLKAVDMFRAVGDGRVKAIWIMSTNPVDSLPEADSVRAALKSCPFVAVSDIAHTDTTRCAHVLLPATGWGEKDGTVTNSERRISRQRAFLTAPGEARPDWWHIAQVARRMGYAEAFPYTTPAGIFAEHARLSALKNNGTRDFDIGAFADADAAEYDALTPFQWPQRAGRAAADTRFFKDGGFFTPDKRARFVATPYRAPATSVSPRYPLALNTGRIRDQWHTMTRTAKAARLMGHIAEPFVEIHPMDAAMFGITAAHLATLQSPHGAVVVRALVTDRVLPGTLFAPIHWTDQLASSARIDALVGAHVDPVSGQPELKHTPVRVEPFKAAWYGFAIGLEKPSGTTDYWALAAAKSGWRAELAGLSALDDPLELLKTLLPSGAGADILAYHDAASGQHRRAAFQDNRLIAALFVAPAPVTVARAYLADQLGVTLDTAAARYRLLAGRAPDTIRDPGPIVCACLEVGRNQILDVITSGQCTSVDAIGAATRAGTNCGSCRAEIGGLLDAARLAKAS
jgi:assimilatory nitrate reductase catalytic subunit